MELTLRIEEEGSGRSTEQVVDVAPGDEVAAVLQAEGINPQTVLVERDGNIITHRDTVAEEDTELVVFDVISGG